MFIYLLILNYIISNDLISCFNLRDLDDDLNLLKNENIENDTHFNCGDDPEKYVHCKDNFPDRIHCKEGSYSQCMCKPGYVTEDLYKNNYNNETQRCNYKQKKQLTSFLLELFVGFGAGHFYRGKYLMASLKLVAFLFGIYIICLFPITAKCISDCCDSDCLVVLVSIFFYLAACGLATWFIFDLVYFGKNKYKDKHDIPLQHW
jgi:TM2 domain-containing membrane protein YozV